MSLTLVAVLASQRWHRIFWVFLPTRWRVNLTYYTMILYRSITLVVCNREFLLFLSFSVRKQESRSFVFIPTFLTSVHQSFGQVRWNFSGQPPGSLLGRGSEVMPVNEQRRYVTLGRVICDSSPWCVSLSGILQTVHIFAGTALLGPLSSRCAVSLS